MGTTAATGQAVRNGLLTAIAGSLAVDPQILNFRIGICEIRCIQIIFTGNTDQREQGIASRIGQGRTHPLRPLSSRNRADRPVRCNPFPGGMRQNCVEPDDASGLVNRGRLDGRDLVLA